MLSWKERLPSYYSVAQWATSWFRKNLLLALAFIPIEKLYTPSASCSSSGRATLGQQEVPHRGETSLVSWSCCTFSHQRQPPVVPVVYDEDVGGAEDDDDDDEPLMGCYAARDKDRIRTGWCCTILTSEHLAACRVLLSHDGAPTLFFKFPFWLDCFVGFSNRA